MDLHNSDHNLKLKFERLEKSDICEENKLILRKFARDLKAEGISNSVFKEREDLFLTDVHTVER